MTISKNPLQYLGVDATNPPNVFTEPRAPNSSDNSAVIYKVGDIWVDSVGDDVYTLASLAGGSATWVVTGADTGAILSLTGNTGGVIHPDSSGDVNIVGTSGISVAGVGSTLTISPASISTNIQVFIGNGTYNPTTGMQQCIIEVVGGGGAGGSTNATVGGATGSVGAGGGAATYVRALYSAATIGSSQAIVVGTGGAPGTPGGPGGLSSVGALISCPGGSGGASSAESSAITAAGGAGGGGATIAGEDAAFSFTGIQGGNGSVFASATSTFGSGGAGGNCFFGGGANTNHVSANTTTQRIGASVGTGASFGSGGSGACTSNTNFPGVSASGGGAGGGGLIIVTEFIA